MKTNNRRFKVNASIDYNVVASESNDVEYIIELPIDTNDDDLDYDIEQKVNDMFLLENVHEDIVGDLTDIYNLEWEELEPISPMKVMELEGEKKLFED